MKMSKEGKQSKRTLLITGLIIAMFFQPLTVPLSERPCRKLSVTWAV